MATVCHKSKLLRCYQKESKNRRQPKPEIVSENGKTCIQSEVQAICKVLRETHWNNGAEEMMKKAVGKLTTAHVQEVLKHVKNVQTSVGFFLWAGRQVGFKHNSVTYHSILKLVGHAEEFQYLEKLLIAMRADKCKLNTTTFNIVISSYGRAGLTRKAWAAFSKMRAFRCIPDNYTYNALMNAYVKKGAWNRVKELYSQMFEVGPAPDSYTFNTLIDGLSKANRHSDASLILREMVISGYSPSVISYNTLMEGLCKECKVDEACSLMSNMLRHGCIPTVITYNILIKGMCKVERMDDVHRILHIMQETGCFPDVRTYTIVINGHMNGNNTDEAWRSFLEMERRACAPDVITYGVLIDGFCKANRLEAGFELMGEALEKMIPLNTVLYTMFLDCLCKTSKAELARATLDDMIHNQCSPDVITYRALINGLSKSGKIAKAYDLMAELVKYDSDTLGLANYKALIDGLCKSGFLDEAIEWFNELSRNKIVPDIIIYKLLVRTASRNDRLEDAYRILETMIETDVVNGAELCYEMMLGCCERGKFYMASNILEQLSGNLKIVDGVHPQSLTSRPGNDDSSACSNMEFYRVMGTASAPETIIFIEALLYFCQRGVFSLAVKLLEAMMVRDTFNPISGGTKLLHAWLIHGELHKVMSALLELQAQRNNFT